MLKMGPVDDQHFGTAETCLRTNFSRYTLDHRNNAMLANDACLMHQETGEFIVTISGRDSNGDEIMHILTIDVGFGLIFDCFDKCALKVSWDSLTAFV